MTRRLLTFLALALLAMPALAAESLPGDACSAANNLQFTGGPEVAGGGGHALLCQGGTWKSILSFNSAAGLTKLGNQTCATNEILKFNGTTWACAADASGMSGLPALTSASIWVGNASNAAMAVAMSGDATLSNAGVLTIGSNAVGSAEITDGTVALADLSATGAASATTYLRGDNTWATMTGSDDLGNHTATQALAMGSFPITSAATIGTSGILKVGSQTTCAAGDTGGIRYVGGAAPFEYCDGGGTWRPFRQPRCTNDATGECFVASPRSGDDAQFIATNIKSGINILGVTGSVIEAAANCTNNGTTLCTLPATRSSGDADFIAANIAAGVNVLGVTGTLSASGTNCTNDATGACLLAATRNSSDSDLVPSKIFCGVNILGVVGTYGGDTTPSTFSLTALIDVEPLTQYESIIRLINGLSVNCPVSVSLSGSTSPQFRTCSAADCSTVVANWASSGTILNGQYLQLRQTPSAAWYTANTATVTVGTLAVPWVVTTVSHTNGFGWGGNTYGSNGTGGSIGGPSSPTPMAGDFTDWTDVSARYYNSCGIRGGLLYCWGMNIGGSNNLNVPTQFDSNTGWSTVGLGDAHGCAIRGGALYCFGYNDNGKTGLGVTTGRQTTAAQVGSTTGWAAVSGGTEHSCGIRSGALYCWGSNSASALGIAGGNQSAPAQVGSNTDWTAVSAGKSWSCGIRAGELYCWGDNSRGYTGLGTQTGATATPTRVGTDTGWTDIAAGTGEHSCGIRSGAVYCWGRTTTGATGTSTSIQTTPFQVGAHTDWASVTVGTGFSCGIRAGGELYCWGGISSIHPSSGNTTIPAQIGANTDWTIVSGGESYAIATRPTF